MPHWGPTLIALLSLAWMYWGRLGGLDEPELARRLLSSRGVLCTPKIVERPQEGVLRVVCADGVHTFEAEPSCDESFACSLGFEAACWEHSS